MKGENIMSNAISIVRVIFWLIVLILCLCNKMMLAMDLMAIGMLAEAIISIYHQHQVNN